jgi:flagellar motility protein MotE (MotC chaperone)
MWEDPGRDTRRRLTVALAADALGITVDAVRSRVKRGTIDHERVGGRVYVLLGDDESRPGQDQYSDQVSDQGARETEDRTAELIATLREQLQAERQAHAEARRLLAAALERIPAIEAPQEASEASETVEEEPERAEPHPASGEAQESVQRPWWRKLIGR